MKGEVRLYQDSDYLLVNEILQEAFGVSKKEFHDNQFQELVITVDQFVCGYLLLTKVLNPILDRYYYLVDYVCINSKYRGLGLGEQLIEEACKICSDNQAMYMQLTCRRSRLAAHKLYEKCGFVMRDSDIFRKELL